MSAATWRSALVGFTVTVAFAVIVTVWFAYVVSVPTSWASVSEVRAQALGVGWMIFAVAVIHWLASAILGKGRIHALAIPNLLLGAGLVLYVVMASNNFYGWADPNCDQFPQTHTGSDITRIGECPSISTFFTAMEFLILSLLLASLVCRIMISRRRAAIA